MSELGDLIARRRPVLGTWVKLPAVESVELLALAGFDLVVVDLEHAPLDPQTTSAAIGAAAPRGLLPLVRVPDHAAATIQRVLDCGAGGVVVPHVDTPEEAAAVVAATRFPPAGVRGFGATSRAGAWGLAPREEYLRRGVSCVVQLESRTAMRNAQQILAVDGVAAVLIGAADLSVSTGLPESHPEIVKLIDEVLAACAEAGIPCGTAIGADASLVGPLAARGFSFVMLSNDATMLGQAASSLVRAARAATTGDR